MKVEIQKTQIEVVSDITIDGKKYPICERNIDIAEEYLQTKDEKCLEGLTEVVFSF